MNKITRIVAALFLVAAVPTLASCGKSTSTSSTGTEKYKYGKLEIEALGGGFVVHLLI
ncbi:hypothetical protein [Clostridium tyrobutyricum]|uniref:hypothetical protein n=1 Tax=Clostridium tyrobutyricum TaxID=1519 RepID=UPI0020CE3E45|nr:hypothetical protein [Clostridium tyrobutyricum]